MRELTLETTQRTQFVDITSLVLDGLGDPVQEPRADNTVADDLQMAFDRIVEDGWPYTHFEEHEQNPWSHVRAALAGSSIVIPLEGGKPALGTWQGIFFCEFDGPRTRRVLVATLQ